jgi:hypothetical protein
MMCLGVFGDGVQMGREMQIHDVRYVRIRQKRIVSLLPFKLPERQLEENQSISSCLKGSLKKIHPSQAA